MQLITQQARLLALQGIALLFVMEDFQVFARATNETAGLTNDSGLHGQSLLYSLFNIMHDKKVCIAIIGMSKQVRVMEKLEKRIKSRFTPTQVCWLCALETACLTTDWSQAFVLAHA